MKVVHYIAPRASGIRSLPPLSPVVAEQNGSINSIKLLINPLGNALSPSPPLTILTTSASGTRSASGSGGSRAPGSEPLSGGVSVSATARTSSIAAVSTGDHAPFAPWTDVHDDAVLLDTTKVLIAAPAPAPAAPPPESVGGEGVTPAGVIGEPRSAAAAFAAAIARCIAATVA
eukprot:27122-Pelagococcus_subviridis.AAC.2